MKPIYGIKRFQCNAYNTKCEKTSISIESFENIFMWNNSNLVCKVLEDFEEKHFFEVSNHEGNWECYLF